MDEKTLIGRRSFIRRLGLGLAGALVAPTLAETLAIGAKKYFFLQENSPASENALFGIPEWTTLTSGVWMCFDRSAILMKARQVGRTELNRKMYEVMMEFSPGTDDKGRRERGRRR